MHRPIYYRLIALVIVPVLALSALVFAAPGHALAAGSIRLSRTTVERGDRVAVSGYGFAANDAVVISTGFKQFDGHTKYVQVTPHTDNAGSFTTTFTVPGDITAGTYVVTARDFHGNSATEQLTVLPLIVFNPKAKNVSSATVVAGGFFFAAGYGFKPAEDVQLSGTFPLYNGNAVSVNRTVQADAKGSFRDVMLQVPFDSKIGNVGMTATGATSGSKASANVNVTYRPYLSLNAATYRPGSSMSVTGHGFIPGSTVHVSVPITGGSSTFTVSKDVAADNQGNFATSLDLPTSAPAGDYKVSAIGSIAGLSASHAFTISLSPVVTLALGSVLPGQSVKVTGGGFSSNVTVHVSATFPLYGGGSKTVSKDFTTDGNGAFSGYFYVPGHAAAGTVSLTAKGPHSQAHTSLQIRHLPATIHVTPGSLLPGSTATIKGTGYPANDKVDISIAVTMTDGSHRTLSATATTGADGTFNVALAIPGDVAIGTYTVVARSEGTGRAPTAKLYLSVAGRLSVQPASAQPGHTVTVHGSGFGANVPVTVSATFSLYAGGTRTVSRSVRTDSSGNLTTTISVPRGASSGSTTVVARGPNARVTANLAVGAVKASVTASPLSVIPGSTVYINGAGYLVGSHIDITVAIKTLKGAEQTLTATATVNPNGSFSVPLQIPADAVGGSYTVTAKSRESGRAPTAKLQIVELKASLIATPATAAPGTKLSVNGFGYSAGTTVTLTLNGQKLGTATTGTDGKFSTTLTVPVNTATGQYTLQAAGSAGRTSTSTITVNRQVSTHFYFASLYTGTGYHEYLTILNPSSIKARVTITYEPKTGPTKTKVVSVHATSRFTEDVNADIGFKVAAAAVVIADVPIAAERLVYHGTDGSIVPGVRQPATTWYFANGNTSGKYREYLAIQNPSNSQIQVAVRLLPTHRSAFTVYRTMAPLSRTTVKVADYVRDAVGAVVSSSTPIVANRTIFIHHGMNSKMGVTAPGRSWYFAAGPADGVARNYLGLINTAGARSHVTLHIYGPYGAELKTINATIRPYARTYWLMNREVGRTDVAVLVQTSRPSVVEQTTYVGRMHDDSTDTFGVQSPAKTWEFAAVNTGAGGDILNVFNPNLAAVPVVVQFMPVSGAVTQRTYVIAPLSHQRIDVGRVYPNAQLGLVVTSDTPIVTMNRLYFNQRLGSATTTGVHG